jgi:hypothetical protein
MNEHDKKRFVDRFVATAVKMFHNNPAFKKKVQQAAEAEDPCAYCHLPIKPHDASVSISKASRVHHPACFAEYLKRIREEKLDDFHIGEAK